ncbi:hypothetical protein [Rubrobacter calidifluminis]|uniref:hypothetical protein n=1 Tax=Rubrobacter calidifluminis TaxID=1392640 RepID=UPI0023611545|nr:hypothetical protein [Rubrobacter calidifluminis]
MIVAERRSRREMTEFGKTLNKLMVNHEVFGGWQELRRRLDAVGYHIGQSRLSQYLYGDRNPQDPQKLFDAISAALGLTEEEEMRLAYSFAYPKSGRSRGGLSQETIDKARRFEGKIRSEQQEDKGESSRGAKGRGV